MPTDGMRSGGILPAIIGTLYLTLGTAIFFGAARHRRGHLPGGICPGQQTDPCHPHRHHQPGPGFPRWCTVCSDWASSLFFLKFGTSILAASLTLSIMTLPVIISTSEEALRAVPNSFRVVSTSLGATQWQTIRRIILPQSLPGILTGVILGLERAAGENRADPVYRGDFLLATTAAFAARRDHGVAVSSVRDLHPGAGYVGRNSIWHCAGAAGVCAVDEYHRVGPSAHGPAPAGSGNRDKRMNIVEIEHFFLSYSDGTESLKDINLSIPANQISVIFGPAGGGKSTLLRALKPSERSG